MVKNKKQREPFYPIGTDLKKLAKAFVQECKHRKSNNEFNKKYTLTLEDYFKMVNNKKQ